MAHILIIDDDALVRKILRQALEREGYKIVDASNGEEGISLQRREMADLIITDIVMPEKEGIETIMELKKEFPDVKIIAISGGGVGASDNYLAMAKKFGANFTFSKPVEIKALVDAVREILG